MPPPPKTHRACSQGAGAGTRKSPIQEDYYGEPGFLAHLTVSVKILFRSFDNGQSSKVPKRNPLKKAWCSKNSGSHIHQYLERYPAYKPR